jgi:pimeloyl-ACP methyl ester carboxylesterase
VRVWPGAGEPALALVHATGFCTAVWEPVVEELRAAGVGIPVFGWDQRSHGSSDGSAVPFDWWELGRDGVAVIEALRGAGVVGERLVGVGHSSGGAALAMTEILQPGTFEALVLVEPIIPPPPYGRLEDHPLAVGARRRREEFGSRDEAFANFVAKDPFRNWDGRALAAYVDGCFTDEGGTWRLACPPTAEAEYYASAGSHAAWERLGEIAPPASIVAGTASDSHPREWVETMAQQFGNGRAVFVEGATHFLPMEDPALVARLVGAVVHRPPSRSPLHATGRDY